MTDDNKKLIPAVWSQIKKSQKILFCFHPRPDPDSIGSNLGLALALKKFEKDVTVLAGDDTTPPPSLGYMPGYDTIVKKRFSDVILSDFDLFISVDAGDLQRVSSMPVPTFPLSINTVVLDHHKGNPEFGNLNIVDPESMSASQVVWEVLESSNLSLVDSDIVTCLYSGIWTDTGNLISATSRTFEILAKMMTFGIDTNRIIKSLRSSKTKEIQLVGKFMSRLETFFGGKMVVTSAKYTDFKEAGISDEEIGEIKEKAVGQLTYCSDSNIQALIYEYLPGLISISLRSFNPDKSYDISKIAKEMGGGGHPGASSAKFKGTLADARKLLLETSPKLYPDLKN